ncbi:MAG TPA: TIGR03435 family protein [Bryobacteraceae bacterium]|nr:TIGR03435 family protein [Bryobacteraceae bacterium]
MRAFPIAVLLAGAVFCQTSKRPASFEAADVHVSAPVRNPYMRGPRIHNDRYEIRNANMVDLTATAYGVDKDKVIGGPIWLEMDRYDVLAKMPPRTDRAMQNAMLQVLLADRFKLVIHHGNALVPAYALTVVKPGLLKKSDGSGNGFCRFELPNRTGQADAPGDFERCSNITMAKFAEQLPRSGAAGQYLNQHIVVDQTGLEGNWDFSFHYTWRLLPGQGETTTLFDALEKQLGLKLAFTKATLPVIIVDSVNEKPTDDLPNIGEILKIPPPPTEFEVAVVKPSAPGERSGIRIGFGGALTVSGITLRNLIRIAWNLPDELIFGEPSWTDDTRFDIIAKGTTDNPADAPLIDIDTTWTMLRSLLQERFQMKTHTEERMMKAYNLAAVKPKLKKADPASRTWYREGPGPDGKDPRNKNPLASRLITVQNMTMAQFAAKLPVIASGYITSPVVDATGIEGAWDFTLSFSPAGLDQFVSRSARGGDTAGAVPQASDPSGVIPLPEALEKQLGLRLETVKRMVPVLVIDHIEPKPIEN